MSESTTTTTPSSASTFRFHMLSDVHLEFLFPPPEAYVEEPNETRAQVAATIAAHPVLNYIFNTRGSKNVDTNDDVEYLALLGDIGYAGDNSFQYQLAPFLRACCAKYNKGVFYVCGNHCYYSSKIDTSIQNLTKLSQELPNFHLLNRNTFDVPGTDVRILGCTLWTKCKPESRHVLNDYRWIKKFGVDEMWDAHEGDVAWLMEELRKANHEEKEAATENENEKKESSPRRCIVFTHHCPILKGIVLPEDEREHQVEDEYQITGTPLIPQVFNRETFPALRSWCYGHSHWNHKPHYLPEGSSPETNGIKVMCNQVGYPDKHEPYRKFKNYLPAVVDQVFEI